MSLNSALFSFLNPRLRSGDQFFQSSEPNGTSRLRAYARKQWSDWLNGQIQSSCTCGTHYSTMLWHSLPNDNVKFPNLETILMTTWTHNSKYLLQLRFFQSICSINKGGEEKVIITMSSPSLMFIFKLRFRCCLNERPTPPLICRQFTCSAKL